MRKQQGLSLIELMISITLGLVLMTGVVQMFLSSRVVFSTQQGMSRIQESGRLAIEFMARDIRMAGHYGCLSRDVQPVNGLNSPADFRYRMEIGLEGFTGVPGGSNLIPAPSATSDVLVVRTASGNVANLSAINDINTVTVKGTGSVANACAGSVASLSGICPADILVVSDCLKAQIFQATSVALAGTDVAIGHAAVGTPGNAIAAWGGAIVSPQFSVGTEVVVASNIVYYIADNPTSGEPSLYQNINGQNPSLQLFEGVEDMHLSFSRANSPANYQTVAQLGAGAWTDLNNPVVSVRIQLLVRSIEDNIVDEPQAFLFPGEAAEATTPADRRMRQVFTNTVGVRGRLP